MIIKRISCIADTYYVDCVDGSVGDVAAAGVAVVHNYAKHLKQSIFMNVSSRSSSGGIASNGAVMQQW